MGIFFCGAGLVAVSVQAAPEASATTDGQTFHSGRSDSLEFLRGQIAGASL